MKRAWAPARWALAILLGWMGSQRAADPAAVAGPRSGTRPGAVGGPGRVWTDATGKYKVEAALADVADGKVRLKTADGKMVAIAVDKLSVPDRQYVGQWAELKNEYPWLDANVPFDAVAFLAPIPEAENAAMLYPDALFEFSGDMALLFPPEERGRRQPIAQRRGEEFMRLFEARRKDPRSVDPRAVDAWLAEYETGFKKLALAQQRPGCVLQTEYRVDTLFPQVQACREVARVVAWRTRRDVQRGDFDRSIQGIETVLRLSRDVRNKGGLIAQLVSVAMDGICCQEVIPDILLAPGLRPEHCDRLLAAMARHEAETPDPFVELYRTAYLEARNSHYDIQHGTGSFDKGHMEKMGTRAPVDSPAARLRFFLQLGGTGGRLAVEKYGRRPAQRMKEIERLVNSMTAEDYAREAEALSRVYAPVLALAGQTMLQRSRACSDPAIVEALRNTTVAVFLEPQFVFVQALLRDQAALRGTQCLVALRRWQLEHRGLPPDLDTLVKAAGMKAVPIDPYCDQPMRMTVLQGTPVIYSVGADGKDDKATVVWDLVPGHPGDYVFRLEPSVR